MKLFSVFLSRSRKPAAVAQPADTEVLVLDDGRADHEDRTLGCGWFDSSHALQAGLLVREHATPEALTNDLPLAGWLQLQLAAWCWCEPDTQPA